ncbi:MAG: hypothetical protein IPK25_08395 [Saprospiraceae bacterium]|nr:hypothetical protein [Saprospiraceae bacterium]
MKHLMFICVILVVATLDSCVQKTYERKVKFLLDVSGIDNIKSVGIRGAQSPLNWETDIEMKPVFKDSMYAIDITFVTGYLFTEVKFVVNGAFELQYQDNRKILFDTTQDTTVCKIKFNIKS